MYTIQQVEGRARTGIQVLIPQPASFPLLCQSYPLTCILQSMPQELQPSIHTSTHLSILPPTHPSIHPFIHSYIHSSTHPPIYSPIHPPIHPPCTPQILIEHLLYGRCYTYSRDRDCHRQLDGITPCEHMISIQNAVFVVSIGPLILPVEPQRISQRNEEGIVMRLEGQEIICKRWCARE